MNKIFTSVCKRAGWVQSQSWVRWLLIGAIAVLITQISFFGVYRVRSSSMAPVLIEGNIVGINKCAFGLKLPFLHGQIIHWKLPKIGDIVVVETKMRRRLLKVVIGLPRDVLTVAGRRFVVPKGYIFVGDNHAALTLNNRNFILVPVTNTFGKLAFVVP